MLDSMDQTRFQHQTLIAWLIVESYFKTTMLIRFAHQVEVPSWQGSIQFTQVIKISSVSPRSQCVSGLQSNVLIGAAPYALPINIAIFPEYLKKLNFKSHAVGKWHLGSHTYHVTPIHRGFLSHTGYWTGHEDYYDHTAQELYGPVVSVMFKHLVHVLSFIF